MRRVSNVGNVVNGDGTFVEPCRSVPTWVAICPHPKPSRAVAVLDGVLGLETATVDIGGTLATKGRGRDDNAAVACSVDGVGVIKGADKVLIVRLRVPYGGWLRFADQGVLVAWPGPGGNDAFGEMGVSAWSVVDIIFVEANTELLLSGIAATIIPIVSFRVNNTLDIGEIAAYIWIG